MTITLTREEAQQVLDALEYNQANWQGKDKAIETLRARLSAPEPVPVAWEYCGALFYDKEEVFAWHERGDIGSTPPKPLYTAPPQQECMPDDLIATYEKGFIDGMQKQRQSSVDKAVNKMAKREWQGLTDEEKNEITWGKTVYEILDLAEAKLKEKNA
jgi:hypothetical protein